MVHVVKPVKKSQRIMTEVKKVLPAEIVATLKPNSGGKMCVTKKRSEEHALWNRERNAVRRRIQMTMGRQDIISQFTEMFETEADPRMFTSVPFCSGIELRDFHEDLAYELETDAYWASLESHFDFEDDSPEIDPEVVELMDGHLVDAADVCEDIDTWRHSPDLLDNFDDDSGFIGYFN